MLWMDQLQNWIKYFSFEQLSMNYIREIWLSNSEQIRHLK
jgi:hypothetical protein